MFAQLALGRARMDGYARKLLDLCSGLTAVSCGIQRLARATLRPRITRCDGANLRAHEVVAPARIYTDMHVRRQRAEKPACGKATRGHVSRRLASSPEANDLPRRVRKRASAMQSLRIVSGMRAAERSSEIPSPARMACASYVCKRGHWQTPVQHRGTWKLTGKHESTHRASYRSGRADDAQPLERILAPP
jgi:hypothetical protein